MNHNLIPHIFRRREPAYLVSDQCDCACSASAPVLQGQALSLPPGTVQQSPHLHTLSLLDDYRLVFAPSRGSVGDGIAVMNDPAWEILSHFEQPRHILPHPVEWQAWGEEIVTAALVDFISLGLLESSSTEAISIDGNSDVLSAWLHLTDRCNLRCDYCYLPHVCADMSSTTGRAAIDATFRSALRNGYRVVKLKYGGGEPLLQFPLIIELQRYAQSLAGRYGFDLDGVVLSNGTLLNAEMVEMMQAANLRLMISLDGRGEFHDCQRHYGDGRGTFDAVACAIDLAISQGLVPDISITVSNRNIRGLPDVVAWVLERDLPFSLNFYRENDHSANLNGLRLEEESIIKGVLAAYRVIEANLPHRSLLASLGDRTNLAIPHRRPCSVGQNYMVFDTQGKVSKCQMQMGDLITDASVVDPLTLIRTAEGGIRNLAVDEKEECRECKWRYWCAGGCPLQAYRTTGRYDAKSPNCNIYRELFPEIVRLEGLRLLKYAANTAHPLNLSSNQ